MFFAYPSCHLVAAIDSTTGTIVSGIQYDAAGTPTIVGGGGSWPAPGGGGGAGTPRRPPVALDPQVGPTTPPRASIGPTRDFSAWTDWRKRDSSATRPHQMYDIYMSAGGGQDKEFPDNKINSDDRQLHANLWLTLSWNFYLPTMYRISE